MPNSPRMLTRALTIAAAAALCLSLTTASCAAAPAPLAVKPAALTAEAMPAAPMPAAAVDNTTILYDVYGQRVDAHDGDLLQDGGLIYLYGTAYGCGFTLNKPGTAYCGVRVYTTTDLRTFTPAGKVGGQYAFDHTTSAWQTLCAPAAGVFGCFRPHVVKRPLDGRFVMWLNTGFAGYVTLVADNPAGPFTPTGVTPKLAQGTAYGDQDITIAPDGRGYVTYTIVGPTDNAHTLVIEELDATLTTGTGRFVVTDAFPNQPDLVEAPALFYGPNQAWYLVYSNPARAYAQTGSGVMNGPRNTPDPIGSYILPRSLNDTSCGGQPAGVWPVKDAAGAVVFVYGSDVWDNGNANEAKATNYFGNLTFNAGIPEGRAIDAYNCQPSWTL